MTKVTLVSGSAGGIGGACVAAFRAAGYAVVGVDAQPGDDVDVVGDLAVGEAAESSVALAIERHGRLDVVVAAHGGSGRRLGDGPVDMCTADGWDATLNDNLRSLYKLCHHSVPRLLEAHGALVTIGSVLGLVGGDEDFATHAYAAAKAGAIGLTRAIATTYASRGLRANVVAPGLIATPMSERAQTDPRIRARLAELQPLTRDFGRPEDVAQAAIYLAQAEFVTGAVLTVDGGWTAR